jgi:hypothetical protein
MNDKEKIAILWKALQDIIVIRPSYNAARDDLWLNRGEVERIAKEAIRLADGCIVCRRSLDTPEGTVCSTCMRMTSVQEPQGSGFSNKIIDYSSIS